MGFRAALHTFLVFGIKQAYACLFGGWLLCVIIGSAFWYPFHGLYRYDFLFLCAVGFQLLLIATRLEHPREIVVILMFHVLATGMELFKTAPGIGSWNYPGPALIRIAGVPLFALLAPIAISATPRTGSDPQPAVAAPVSNCGDGPRRGRAAPLLCRR